MMQGLADVLGGASVREGRAFKARVEMFGGTFIRSGTAIASEHISTEHTEIYILVMWFVAAICGLFAGYAGTLMHIASIVAIIGVIVIVVFGRRRFALTTAQVHKYSRMLHAACWILCSFIFWIQTCLGTLARLGPDEADRMIGCSCFWAVASARRANCR